MATTANLTLNQPAYNSSAWDVPLNANEDILDAAFGGTTSVALTNVNVTLTSTQLQAMQLRFTGAISTNIIVYVPAGYYGRWTVTNATTGSYTVTFASASGGTTYAIGQGYSSLVCCDSTGVFASDSGLLQGGVLSTLSVTGNSTLGSTGSNTTTINGKLTLASTTSQLSALLNNLSETVTISATSATGTINYDITTQSILYYTTNASANFTVNFRGNSGVTLNSLMSTGQSVTVAFLNTNGATAYYNNAVTIDGASVTPKWINGASPSAGYTNSVDTYTYTIIKTGYSAYLVLATLAKFA